MRDGETFEWGFNDRQIGVIQEENGEHSWQRKQAGEVRVCSKRRKQKKSGISWSENRVGTTLNTRSWHEGSNPFELLMVETLENEEAPELE